MIDREKLKRETGNKFSRTMRVQYRIYDELAKLKAVYGEQQGLRVVTFNDFLLECCALGELLLSGQEFYVVDAKFYDSIELARGAAAMLSARTGKAYEQPAIYLKLGKDEFWK